jgi:hypothetical protein
LRPAALGLIGVVAACATGVDPAGDPDAIPPHIDADVPDAPSGGRVDADLGAPDAAPRPDAAPLPPDAMPPPPDAMPLPPDAMPPPPPDAAPGTPDAAPLPDAPPACTPMNVNLLANAAFESGPGVGWIETSTGGYEIILQPTDLPFAAHTAPYAAWLGGYTNGTDTLLQSVTVPAGATQLRLTGYRVIGTTEVAGGGAWDYVYLRLRNSSGVVLETLGTYSNVDTIAAWTSFSFTASSPHAGESIQLYIEATNDIIDHSNFFFDTLSLEASVCL